MIKLYNINLDLTKDQINRMIHALSIAGETGLADLIDANFQEVKDDDEEYFDDDEDDEDE